MLLQVPRCGTDLTLSGEDKEGFLHAVFDPPTRMRKITYIRHIHRACMFQVEKLPSAKT